MADIPSLSWLLGRIYPVRPTTSRGDFLDDTGEPAHTLEAAQAQAATADRIMGHWGHQVKQYVRLLIAEQREVGGEVIHCGLRCPVCGDGSEIIFSGVTLVLHGPGDKQALCVSYVCRACDTRDALWLQPDEGFDA